MANKTKAEKQHLNKVASLGCIVCKNNGYPESQAEIHHIREGVGMAQRSSNLEVIPLCLIHHRSAGGGEVGFHHAPSEFIRRYGTERQLLEQVNELLS